MRVEDEVDDLSEPSPLLLRVEQVAELLSVGRSRVYDLMRTGELPSVRIRATRRVPRSAVLAYVDRLMAESEP